VIWRGRSHDRDYDKSMTRGPRFQLIIILGCVVLGSSCSYAFVHEAEHRTAHEPCTSLPIAPIIDTVGGLGGLFFTGDIPAVAAGSDNVTLDGAIFYTGVAAVAAGVFIVSAVHGYRATAKCRDLHAHTDEQLAAADRAEHGSVEHDNQAPPVKLEDDIAALHDRARAAARIGRCGIASYIVARIRGLDPAYAASTVDSDPDLQPCLTAPAP
jgi:hypothetical protein